MSTYRPFIDKEYLRDNILILIAVIFGGLLISLIIATLIIGGCLFFLD